MRLWQLILLQSRHDFCHKAAWILVSLLCFSYSVARADIWTFVDEKGVTHIASEQLDSRYEVFFRSAQPVSDPAPPAAEAEEISSLSPPVADPRITAFIQGLPGFRQVRHHLSEASALHNIDVELLHALIATESGFDPKAVSPKGAIGLMQVMPDTAVRFGVNADARTPIQSRLTEPQTNIQAGTRYLRYLMNLFAGKLELVLAAYNAGEGAVQRAGNQIPNFRETQNYVRTVMQLYALLKPPPPLRPLARVSLDAPRPEPAPPPRLGIPGGAMNRGNMVSNATQTPQLPPVFVIPRLQAHD